MNLFVGLRVMDTYTGHIGTVEAIDAQSYRATVRFAKCVMVGCPSWFKPVVEEDAA